MKAFSHRFFKKSPENGKEICSENQLFISFAKTRSKENPSVLGFVNQKNKENSEKGFVSIFKGLFILFIFSILMIGNVWAQNSNVQISTAATANGTWTLTAGTYTFAPSLDNAVVNRDEIQNRLLGVGLTAGNVTIVTARAGGGQPGNVTMSATITAANN